MRDLGFSFKIQARDGTPAHKLSKVSDSGWVSFERKFPAKVGQL